jgi:hypothetical protein
MADQNVVDSVNQITTKMMDALASILSDANSPAALQAQQILLQRMALESDVFPSRVPPPRNITEIGGYFNLMEKLNETAMRTQALAAIMGVAGPNPMPGLTPTGQVLFDVLRANDRPAGAVQASIPVQFRVRNDFAPALDAALKTIHDAGCMLPVLAPPLGLPPATPVATTPPTDLLRYLGRTLDLMPTCTLIDPDTDALAVARLNGAGPFEVVALQLNGAAPNAGTVAAQNWSAWKCDANACAENAAARKMLQLTPLLNAAGWVQPAITNPVKLAQPGSWARWNNLTGLIAGVSRYGDELTQRFTNGEIAASSLRDVVDYKWDGTQFAP